MELLNYSIINFSEVSNQHWEKELSTYTKNMIHPYYYIQEEKLEIFEDDIHEFKMINIQNKQDIPEKTRMLAKYICAFLNTNSGVIYVGVNDNGVVKGVKLEEKILRNFKKELDLIISKYDKHVIEKQLVTYNFKKLYTRNYIELNNVNNKKILSKNKNEYFTESELIIKQDYYVLEIFVLKGIPFYVYFTTLKEPTTEDFECYIKLNGTLKKLEGKDLHRYTKRKIKNYCLTLKNNKKLQNIKKESKGISIEKFDKVNYNLSLITKEGENNLNTGKNLCKKNNDDIIITCNNDTNFYERFNNYLNEENRRLSYKEQNYNKSDDEDSKCKILNFSGFIGSFYESGIVKSFSKNFDE